MKILITLIITAVLLSDETKEQDYQEEITELNKKNEQITIDLKTINEDIKNNIVNKNFKIDQILPEIKLKNNQYNIILEEFLNMDKERKTLKKKIKTNNLSLKNLKKEIQNFYSEWEKNFEYLKNKDNFILLKEKNDDLKNKKVINKEVIELILSIQNEIKSLNNLPENINKIAVLTKELNELKKKTENLTNDITKIEPEVKKEIKDLKCLNIVEQECYDKLEELYKKDTELNLEEEKIVKENKDLEKKIIEFNLEINNDYEKNYNLLILIKDLQEEIIKINEDYNIEITQLNQKNQNKQKELEENNENLSKTNKEYNEFLISEQSSKTFLIILVIILVICFISVLVLFLKSKKNNKLKSEESLIEDN